MIAPVCGTGTCIAFVFPLARQSSYIDQLGHCLHGGETEWKIACHINDWKEVVPHQAGILEMSVIVEIKFMGGGGIINEIGHLVSCTV
ncbi:hypothetical protein QQP08_004495 [Theobroma cacao]|nr:hypothetical protein QQP08_004495 [Theobroma cacao]